MWSDADDIRIVWCSHPHIQTLVNICCLVEILPDRMVLIEAIGALVNDHIYTTEPRTNVEFLQHFVTLSNITDNGVNGQHIDNKPLQVQQFYNTALPTNYDTKLYDGFIIVQNDLIIKWKIPTIDVKCLTENTYKVGQHEINLQFVGIPGKIYEINYNYEVMRMRSDRLAASTENEYDVFIQSTQHLLQCIGTTKSKF